MTNDQFGISEVTGRETSYLLIHFMPSSGSSDNSGQVCHTTLLPHLRLLASLANLVYTQNFTVNYYSLSPFPLNSVDLADFGWSPSPRETHDPWETTSMKHQPRWMLNRLKFGLFSSRILKRNCSKLHQWLGSIWPTPWWLKTASVASILAQCGTVVSNDLSSALLRKSKVSSHRGSWDTSLGCTTMKENYPLLHVIVPQH